VVFADGLPLDRTADFVKRARVTRINCTPVHLHVLCALAEKAHGLLLPELRALEVLGSTVTEDLRQRIRQKVSANLYVTYSTTESGVVSVAPPQARIADTVGTLLPGIELQIVDTGDRPLARNEVGIIRIRAPGAIAGYLDDAEATAKAFRGGWFYPGDIGALTEDEQLLFKGRADDMMIYDGINIYPAEIESVLAAHEAVAEAAAFPVASDAHQDVPVAAVKLRAPAAESDLIAYCRSRLGARAPQRVLTVTEFPRNAAGKIMKRELAQRVRGGRSPS
jgi:acyl-coenzyme A synthetase/AMP-(fatty) acid ligase